MRKIFACAFAVLCVVTAFAQSRVTQEHKDRAAEIVSQMTLEEKIDYVGASSADIRLEASFNVE